MLFNSYEFLFGFLPVTLAGFFLLGTIGRPLLALSWLTAASLFFYGWWNPAYAILICGSIVLNFGCGSVLAGWLARGRRAAGRGLLSCGVAVNLAVIVYCKYAAFFLNSLGGAIGTDWRIDAIILPLGISFFTFQQIAYLVDIWRGDKAEHNFIRYALFILFFPHLIAGPIVHPKVILPQLARSALVRPRLENLAIGATIFAIGLFKKVIIADNLAPIVSPVFAAAQAGEAIHFVQAWTAIFGYTFQIYFDFSGYSDMAIGLARLFGVRLSLNFHSPLRATSIIDFWRRWHMTLSRFLRDYLYIALGGNRRGPARRYVNLMLTMLIGGLWHGANWTFVAWGGLHGVYLVANHLWRSFGPRPINRWWSRLVARSLTLLAVAFAMVFFRAESFAAALAILKGVTNLPHTLTGRIGAAEQWLLAAGFRFAGPWLDSQDLRLAGWLAILVGFVWLAPNTQQWLAAYRPAFEPRRLWPGEDELPGRGAAGAGTPPRAAFARRMAWNLRWRPSLAWGVGIGGLACAGLLSLNKVSEFLYFQF
jgi:D-alanyl-lipoteichoic acid acyltransferase DltB (MBOAT superfamily)